MSELQITAKEHEGQVKVTVFELIGEIDSENHAQLTERAAAAFEAGMRYLLIDFSNVTLMSSAGLRSLHTIYSMLQGEATTDKEQGHEFKSPYLKLLNPPDIIRKSLKVVGFERYVEIHTTTVDEALASFG